MARKDEKQKGVYAILNVCTKLAYVGKSNGVGAIIRSVKSKLKKGTFHNQSLQEEYVEYGIEMYDFIKYFPNEGESIAECLDRVRVELMNTGKICVVDYDENDNGVRETVKFIFHNDIEVIRLDGKEIETDKYNMDELNDMQRDIVSILISAFLEKSPDVSKVRKALAEIEIY